LVTFNGQRSTPTTKAQPNFLFRLVSPSSKCAQGERKKGKRKRKEERLDTDSETHIAERRTQKDSALRWMDGCLVDEWIEAKS
jgi:hypothetical protein